MNNVAIAGINSFASNELQSGFEKQNEQVLELPIDEVNSVLSDTVSIYNSLCDTIRSCGIVHRRDLARIIESNTLALMAEKSPTGKFLLINAFIKQLNAKIRGALNTKTYESGKNISVTTKIKARAIQIIEYIRIEIADDPKRKELSLDSQQCRLLFSGKHGEKVSRRDTIRAMMKAKQYWPDLTLQHRPNDGRGTMRLLGRAEDLALPPEFEYIDTKPKGSIWQRSRLDELAVIFGFTTPRPEDF